VSKNADEKIFWRVVLDNEAWIEMKKTRFSQRATAKREILAQEKKAG
jgi:hypothetical protein